MQDLLPLAGREADTGLYFNFLLQFSTSIQQSASSVEISHGDHDVAESIFVLHSCIVPLSKFDVMTAFTMVGSTLATCKMQYQPRSRPTRSATNLVLNHIILRLRPPLTYQHVNAQFQTHP